METAISEELSSSRRARVTGSCIVSLITTVNFPEFTLYSADEMVGGVGEVGAIGASGRIESGGNGSLVMYRSVVALTAVLFHGSVIVCTVRIRVYSMAFSAASSVLFSRTSMESFDGWVGALAGDRVVEVSFMRTLPDAVGRMRSSSLTASMSLAL